MILDACGGRGNGEKDAEGLARAESREGSGRWGGWTGRRGDGEVWMATERGRQGGGIWKEAMRKGEMGRGATGTGRGWQWGVGQREEEMERGAMGKGGRWEGGNGKGERDRDVEKKGQEEGRFHRWI